MAAEAKNNIDPESVRKGSEPGAAGAAGDERRDVLLFEIQMR
jgi:hypothetical protein